LELQASAVSTVVNAVVLATAAGHIGRISADHSGARVPVCLSMSL
jgi:hypothetical protein